MSDKERAFIGPLTGKVRSLGPADATEEQIDPVAQFTALEQLRTDVAELRRVVVKLESVLDVVPLVEEKPAAAPKAVQTAPRGGMALKGAAFVGLFALGIAVGLGAPRIWSRMQLPEPAKPAIHAAAKPKVTPVTPVAKPIAPPAAKPVAPPAKPVATAAVPAATPVAPAPTAPTPATPAATPTPPAKPEIHVRIVAGSLRYHAPRCWVMRSKRPKLMTLSAARADGYKECRYCGPEVRTAVAKGHW